MSAPPFGIHHVPYHEQLYVPFHLFTNCDSPYHSPFCLILPLTYLTVLFIFSQASMRFFLVSGSNQSLPMIVNMIY